MSVDQELLRQACEASASIEQGERVLREAHDAFRIAVRRLHVAGTPLRQIAEALHLSHQRVHQLVASHVGRRRRWKLRGESASDLSCTFCGKDKDQVQKLVAGPHVLICDSCIGAIAGFDRVHAASTVRCSFCGKKRSQVKAMFAGADAQVCRECLDVAREIIAYA